jgi:hypothetical protein
LFSEEDAKECEQLLKGCKHTLAAFFLYPATATAITNSSQITTNPTSDAEWFISALSI